MWILTTQSPITKPMSHEDREKCYGECENKVFPYFCWSEKSRDFHPSGRAAWAPHEPCTWVITGGWVDKEGAREINTRTEENKNR